MFDGHGVGAADGADLLFLQHAQELHLQAHRHVADLVEQQRAAVRGLEQALVGAVRARERAFLVTEELRLEQVLGHRAAVDRDERALLARARAMDRARHELLAGARFARDQHARVGARDHPRLLEAGLHRGAARDDLGAPLVLGLREARDLHRRSTYSRSCCLSTGFVRKPNAPLCVASTASGIVPCAVKQQHAEARAAAAGSP